MNQIPRGDRDAEDIARIRELVARRQLPDFVADFDVKLDDTEGDPVIRIIFKTRGDLPPERAEADRWLGEANRLDLSVSEDVRASGEDRFPLVRFEVLRAPELAHR